MKTLYKNYLLTVLTLILAFNYMDRFTLGLVLQDIKMELDLTDTQLGFLTGIAFALFYAVMGIPIARWADRGNRVIIIALTTALWSVAVILMGIATSFGNLLLIRVAVAVGEAGCLPLALSLIADYFDRAERPRASGIYGMGASLSMVFGYFVAGWLNQRYGWRATFMILGMPGLVLAVLAWRTLVEPRQTRTLHAVNPSLKEVAMTLMGNATFRHILFCSCVAFFFVYGNLQWLPAFFIRSYGMQTSEVGVWFGAIIGLCGMAGTYWGGALASRYAANNERLQLQATAVIYTSCSVFWAMLYLAPNRYVAFVFLGMANLAVNMTNAPISGVIQTLVPERMRAMSFAVFLLFANLIGLGLGPLAVGILSDALRSSYEDESLRYALLALSPGFLWCMWHMWRASRSITRDLASASTRGIADIRNGEVGISESARLLD